MKSFREQLEQCEMQTLSKYAKKSCESKRWKAETPDMYRTDYQRDVGRILYSDAFRRLRMKTQVFLASGLDQHNRTRLTHSMEVAQIAKSIARPLSLNVDLVEAISLGHDLGHTPFGHAGEAALDECLKERINGSFSHNVQSVWLLRKTLTGRKDINSEDYIGYNLTYDVVEGIWKHTKYKNAINEIDDLKYLYPENKASLEGQLVALADRIAYIKHDIDDAARQKLISYSEVEELWKKHFDLDFDKNYWTHYFIYDLIENNQNSEQILFSEPFDKAFNDVRDFIYENVILSKEVQSFDKESKEKIKAIFNYCIKNPDYLISKFGNGNKYKMDKYGVERPIVDFIQWCGDELANEIYKTISI